MEILTGQLMLILKTMVFAKRGPYFCTFKSDFWI